MPTTRDTAKLLSLKARIEKLSPSDRLRLCAELLEQGESDIVETLAGNVVDELRAVRLLKAKTPPEHDWQFYANGTFCRKCGTQIGSGYPCR